MSENVRAAALATAGAGVDAGIILGTGPKVEKHVVEVRQLNISAEEIKQAINKRPYNPTAGGGHVRMNDKPAPKVVPAQKAPPVVKPKTDIPPKLALSMKPMPGATSMVPSLGSPSSNVNVLGGAGSGTGSGDGNGAGVGAGNGPGVYSLNKAVIPPKPLMKIIAAYTSEARDAKLQGFIMVHVTIDAQGIPKNASVSSIQLSTVDGTKVTSDLGLKQNALEAVKNARFAPARELGVAKEFEMIVAVQCSLPR
jgi:TonB family protein